MYNVIHSVKDEKGKTGAQDSLIIELEVSMVMSQCAVLGSGLQGHLLVWKYGVG